MHVGRVKAGLAGTGPVTFVVDDEAVSYLPDGAVIRVVPGRIDDSPTVVRLSRLAWDDLVGQIRTVMSLMITGDLAFERGDLVSVETACEAVLFLDPQNSEAQRLLAALASSQYFSTP